MSGHVLRRIPAVVVVLLFAVPTARGQPMWVREKTIDLSPWFSWGGGVAGTNPWAVETDGTRAFVSGYNGYYNSEQPEETRPIGVLILDDIRGLETGIVPSSLVTNIKAYGVHTLAWDPVREALYSGYDSGGWPDLHCYVVKSDGMGVIDTAFGPDWIACSSEPSGNGYSRPPTVVQVDDVGRFSGGIAIDPGHPGDSDPDLFPGVSYANYGSGRRAMLDGDAGTVTYRTSLDETFGCADTAIDIGFAYAAPPWLTLYRGHAFDPDTGDVYLRTHNRVYKAVRTGKNAAIAPETPLIGPDQGFADAAEPSLMVGYFVEVIPAGSGVTGAPIVAFNSRTDWGGNPARIYLRSAVDGSTTGLAQTELTGAEDGGEAYSSGNGIFSMAYGVDPGSGDPILLVCSMGDLRLDVFVWKEAVAPAISFTGIRRTAAGGIEIEWDSADGVFDVERATDLKIGDWDPVGSVTDQNTFTDETPPDPQGFYRAAPGN